MVSRRLISTVLVICLAALLVLSAPLASAATTIDSSALRSAVTLQNVRLHQAALQAIADANGGTRAASTPGYEASAAYVFSQLQAAGYNVAYQPFQYVHFEELGASQFEQISPNPTVYTYGVDFDLLEYSAAGDVTAPVQAVDLVLPPVGGSTSGCEAADFAGFTPGNIALVQRGTCNFSNKAINAEAAGAAGVIIFNEGNSPDRLGLIGGTLGGNVVDIPVIDIPFALGEQLAGLADGRLSVHIQTNVFMETRTTTNVIAETPGGRTDRVVVVGAHLDSVPGGPGINDNGSGTAVILETALQMARLGIQPVNQVRFAFWGAEESGLIGSQYYVSQLTSRQIKNIAVNLNFDMLGSPNFVRFIYDGDGSATGTAGPNGSGVVEAIFQDYFSAQGLAFAATEFNGRSDYGPFIAVGIPAGGLFTGAEGIKTAEEAAIYGGTAGLAYDPCYHQACDTYANNSDTGLDQMADAAAHAVLSFAMTTSAVNGTNKGKAWGPIKNLEYWGSHLTK